MMACVLLDHILLDRGQTGGVPGSRLMETVIAITMPIFWWWGWGLARPARGCSLCRICEFSGGL